MWPFTKSPKYLPKPEGKFITGCVDVMLDYAEDGIFMRLFYPTKASHQEEPKWVSWFHDNAYLDGIAKAILIKPILLYFVKWWSAGGGTYLPLRYGEKPNTDTKLKCVILSHGYASSRFLNSVMCNELASRCYLVAAIEHRDKSACFTYYYKNKDDAQNNVRTPIEAKIIKFGEGHYSERNAQVNRRAEECGKLLDFLIDLNNGKVPYNVMDDTKPDHDFKLGDLVGNLDLDNFTIAGHSFGGATALLTLSKRKEYRQGILLDPWMFPLKEEETLLQDVTQPLLFVNTQTFHISANVKAMEKFLTNNDREMYTLLSTTHESQTDTVLVLGYWLNWFMKKINPHLALKLNNGLMLRFLKKHTKHAEIIEDLEALLDEHKEKVAVGLTKPWA